jgi:hypothetical protein
MKKGQAYKLNQVFTFSKEDGHPESEIIGIDSYSFKADDGSNKTWNSYTLVPVQKSARFGAYKRWYVVDLPVHGMSFVQIIDKERIPKELSPYFPLTGNAVVTTTGDGELGTGKSVIHTFWDVKVTPHQMYASEEFESSEILYFKTNSIKGNFCAI